MSYVCTLDIGMHVSLDSSYVIVIINSEGSKIETCGTPNFIVIILSYYYLLRLSGVCYQGNI